MWVGHHLTHGVNWLEWGRRGGIESSLVLLRDWLGVTQQVESSWLCIRYVNTLNHYCYFCAFSVFANSFYHLSYRIPLLAPSQFSPCPTGRVGVSEWMAAQLPTRSNHNKNLWAAAHSLQSLRSLSKCLPPIEPSSSPRSILELNRYLFTQLILFCSYQVGSVPKTKQITRELVSSTDIYQCWEKRWREVFTQSEGRFSNARDHQVFLFWSKEKEENKNQRDLITWYRLFSLRE